MGASIAEELGAALDGVELPSGEAGVTESASVDTQATEQVAGDTQSAAVARDEQGRFTAAEKAAQEGQPDAAPTAEQQKPQPQTEQQQGDQAQQAADAKGAMTPPATWSAAGKAAWATLPDGVRREVVKREQDFARGIQQYAEKAKGFDTFMEVSRPYEAMLRSEGSDPAGALKSFLHQAYVLRTASPQQKGELIMQVAQKFGADLSQFMGQPAQQQEGQQDLSHVQQMVQQLVAPHLQRIQQWETEQQTAQQRQEQHMEQEITSQIEAFQTATNEDGTPKHLYFENVRPLMSAYFANGQAQSLEQAYEMACWAHPEVRAALQADQQRTADAKRLEEAKRKAQDAGKAGFNVSGQGGVGIAGATQSSLRDELAAQLDAAIGGQRV